MILNPFCLYSLEHKTYYIISQWRDLQYLPPISVTTESNNGTEIVSSEAIDDVEGPSELSRRNRKLPPDDPHPEDQIVEQDQVAIPVRVKF